MKKKTFPQSDKISVDGYTFSSGELEWARQNLPAIQQAARSNSVLYISMVVAFILGLALYILGFAISTGGISLPFGWQDDLIADLMTELGVTLWTSVILVFFLEVLVELQRKRWQRYARIVEHALQQPADKISTSAETSSEPEIILARLDELIERMARLENLPAEVSAIKTSLHSGK